MNHDIVKMFRRKLDSFTVSDYHGLNSPGLTCYLNCVLQVLFMTKDFREAVKQCCSKGSTTIDRHLGKLFADLQKNTAKTHKIAERLGITDVYEQRDAAEYLEKILCLTSPQAATIFKGELNHRTTCFRCKDTNNSRSFFWTLPLAVGDSPDKTYRVEDGLKEFFKGEEFSEDDKCYCSKCDKKQDAKFECEMTRTPEVLTLLLKKFGLDNKRRRYVKLRCNVDVPQTLRVENCSYDLYALVHHSGTLTGGHYTAQIKSFETQVWYDFDDDIVERVKPPLFGAGEKSLRSFTASLLMYRKVNRCTETDQGNHAAEGGHDESEKGERHGLKHDGRDIRGENLKHMNADILEKNRDDSLQKKKFSGHREYQLRATSVRPHKDIPLRTNGAAEKLRKDGGQISSVPNRGRRDINAWKTLNNVAVKTRTGGVSENGVGINMSDSDLESLRVSSNSCSSSSGQSQRLNEARGRNYFPNLMRKANTSKRNEEKPRQVVSPDRSRKLDTSQTATKRKNSAKS